MSTVSNLKVLSIIATFDQETILKLFKDSGLAAPADGGWLHDLRDQLADAYLAGNVALADIVTAYLGGPDVPDSMKTLGEFVRGLPNFSSLKLCPELDELELESVVGLNCCKVLVQANELIELCADAKLGIIDAVRHQMEVFYFG